MKITVCETVDQIATLTARKAASALSACIDRKGHATFIAASGLSQVKFLAALVDTPDIDWSKTTMYHLDEYIGLPESHPATFRHYMRKHIVDRIQPGTVHFIGGDASDPRVECERLNGIAKTDPIDVAFLGVGVNGHLAFNDPPANFDIADPFTIVDLVESCRLQQVEEEWFATLDAVPKQAITATISHILSSDHIFCIASGTRKASAIKNALTGPISPSCPASILRRHQNTELFLDPDALGSTDEAATAESSPTDGIATRRQAVALAKRVLAAMLEKLGQNDLQLTDN